MRSAVDKAFWGLLVAPILITLVTFWVLDRLVCGGNC